VTGLRKYDFAQFFSFWRYAGLAFSPDGTEVILACNASGQFNLWRMPLTGGPVRQLTAFEEHTARGAIWSPDGKLILTVADEQGTEQFQIYEVPADAGWAYPLTNDPEIRYHLPDEAFAPDGRTFAFTSNERKPTDFDVYVRDVASGATRRILEGSATYDVARWSPDGRHLLVVEYILNTDQNIHLLDVHTGETRLLTPHEGEVIYTPGPFRPDGSGFYLLSNEGREFKGLAFYRFEDGRISWVETPEWDAEDCDLSRNGRLLAWTVNEDGYSKLSVRDLATGRLLPLPDLPEGTVDTLRFAPDSLHLAFYASTATRPRELYVIDLNRATLERLTCGFIGGIPKRELRAPTLVHYPSFDGRQVPAYLYRPSESNARQPVPVVLSIHGGPEFQERPSYFGLYQYLLSRGIGVLAPNIRGSTGYGLAYQRLIHRDWGGGELRDIEAAARYLQSLEWVDSRRIGVFGGSFGGFATLSAVSRLPDYWAAAVDIVGPANLVTFTRSVPPFWKRFIKQWIGDPDEDHDLLVERSPLTYVDNIRAPLLVIQGANDPRVVKAESDQMVERLRGLGRTVEYIVFEDEGHGFTKRRNELEAFRATAEWFTQQLL
jgi:dipeptidyl aminopeptidase/acylaminoacyl peptidase